MKTKEPILQKTASWLVYGIVLTVPLIFGAIIPAVLGLYIFLILVFLGGWLLLNGSRLQMDFSWWYLVPLLLIIYIFFQSVPLPIEWVKILSPARAERVQMVNELAGTRQLFISLSENGIDGAFKALFILALLIFYCALKQVMKVDERAYFILFYCMMAIGALEAVYGLLQFVNPSIGILGIREITSRAAHGTIVYKNQYASLLNMIWPLAVGGALMFFVTMRGMKKEGKKKVKDVLEQISTTKPQSVILSALAVLLILAVLFSLSRGGILSMLFIGLLLLLLLPFSLRRKILVFLLFATAIGGYGYLLGLDTIVSRFSSITGSGETRINLYLSSLPMLLDHWATGVGLGSYTLLSPVYLKGFPANLHYNRAHNEYLELFIELGIPFATLFFCFLFGGIVNLFAKIVKGFSVVSSGDAKIIMAIVSFSGVLGFLAHGLIDFGWRLPANVFFALVLLALCTTSLEAIQEKNFEK